MRVPRDPTRYCIPKCDTYIHTTQNENVLPRAKALLPIITCAPLHSPLPHIIYDYGLYHNVCPQAVGFVVVTKMLFEQHYCGIKFYFHTKFHFHQVPLCKCLSCIIWPRAILCCCNKTTKYSVKHCTSGSCSTTHLFKVSWSGLVWLLSYVYLGHRRRKSYETS